MLVICFMMLFVKLCIGIFLILRIGMLEIVWS